MPTESRWKSASCDSNTRNGLEYSSLGALLEHLGRKIETENLS